MSSRKITTKILALLEVTITRELLNLVRLR